MNNVPEWVRLGQDGRGFNGGFWTNAAADEDSPKFIRSDLVEELERQNAELRRAIMGAEPMPEVTHGQFLEMARSLHSAVDAGMEAVEEHRQTEAALRQAADYISPYLRWTIGNESPGYHPTMPSAVAAFHVAFDIDTEEKRAERMRVKA